VVTFQSAISGWSGTLPICCRYTFSELIDAAKWRRDHRSCQVVAVVGVGGGRYRLRRAAQHIAIWFVGVAGRADGVSRATSTNPRCGKLVPSVGVGVIHVPIAHRFVVSGRGQSGS